MIAQLRPICGAARAVGTGTSSRPPQLPVRYRQTDRRAVTFWPALKVPGGGELVKGITRGRGGAPTTSQYRGEEVEGRGEPEGHGAPGLGFITITVPDRACNLPQYHLRRLRSCLCIASRTRISISKGKTSP